MLVSEKLVLLPLHKDGVASVRSLFQALVGGESRKQPGTAAEIAALGVPVVGVVCNPLTWYLALWRQGCAGKGGLYRRLTDDARWQRVLGRQQMRQRAEDPESQPAGDVRPGLPAEWSAAHAVAVWYADRNDVTAFREWLRAVLGTRALRRIVEAQPAAGSGFRAGGLMTQEYLGAFVLAPEDESLSTLKLDGLQALDQRCAITRLFVRAESPATDVAAVLDQLGVTRDAEQDAAIRALTSVATTAEDLSFFDADSLRLVAQHERLITAKFGYELATGAAPGGAKADRPRARRWQGRGKEGRGATPAGSAASLETSAPLPLGEVVAGQTHSTDAAEVGAPAPLPQVAEAKRTRNRTAKAASRPRTAPVTDVEATTEDKPGRRASRRSKKAAGDTDVGSGPADA